MVCNSNQIILISNIWQLNSNKYLQLLPLTCLETLVAIVLPKFSNNNNISSHNSNNNSKLLCQLHRVPQTIVRPRTGCSLISLTMDKKWTFLRNPHNNSIINTKLLHLLIKIPRQCKRITSGDLQQLMLHKLLPIMDMARNNSPMILSLSSSHLLTIMVRINTILQPPIIPMEVLSMEDTVSNSSSNQLQHPLHLTTCLVDNKI